MTNTNTTAGRRSTRPPLIIEAGYHDRLMLLALRSMKQAPGLARQLLDEVERARVVPSHEMPSDVVRIGSEVTYRDEDTGQVDTVRVVLPQDASVDERRVSVLAPVGAALIGLSVGQRIEWDVAAGRVRRLTVLRVS